MTPDARKEAVATLRDVADNINWRAKEARCDGKNCGGCERARLLTLIADELEKNDETP